MNVYILYSVPYDISVGVFSSIEKALIIMKGKHFFNDIFKLRTLKIDDEHDFGEKEKDLFYYIDINEKVHTSDNFEDIMNFSNKIKADII